MFNYTFFEVNIYYKTKHILEKVESILDIHIVLKVLTIGF